jgi:hypothetical protein
MVLNSNLRNNQSFPESVISTLTSVQSFSIPTANATAANGNYMSIMVNSIYTPFNTNYAFTSSALPYSMRGVSVQGGGAGQNPVGYGNLAALYENYVVLGYSVRVTAVPTLGTDILRQVVVPLGNQEIVNPASGLVNLKIYESQPGAKALTCNSGSTPSGIGVTVLKGNCAKDMGMDRSQYTSRVWSVGGPPTVAQYTDYVGIFLQELNGTNNTQPVVVTIHLSQIVKFMDLVNPV